MNDQRDLGSSEAVVTAQLACRRSMSTVVEEDGELKCLRKGIVSCADVKCMCVCVCMCLCVCDTHMRAHTYTHAHTTICTHTCMRAHTCRRAHTYMRKQTCMRAHTDIRTHTCTCKHRCTHTCMRTHTCAHTRMRTHTCMRAHTCMRTHTHAWALTRACAHTHSCAHIVCMRVCVYERARTMPKVTLQIDHHTVEYAFGEAVVGLELSRLQAEMMRPCSGFPAVVVQVLNGTFFLPDDEGDALVKWW